MIHTKVVAIPSLVEIDVISSSLSGFISRYGTDYDRSHSWLCHQDSKAPRGQGEGLHQCVSSSPDRDGAPGYRQRRPPYHRQGNSPLITFLLLTNAFVSPLLFNLSEYVRICPLHPPMNCISVYAAVHGLWRDSSYLG